MNSFKLSLLLDVIHTVGPRSEKKEVLTSCYEKSLQVLVDNGLRSIAFPCVATGVYGYDKERGANVALGTVRLFLERNALAGKDPVSKEKYAPHSRCDCFLITEVTRLIKSYSVFSMTRTKRSIKVKYIPLQRLFSFKHLTSVFEQIQSFCLSIFPAQMYRLFRQLISFYAAMYKL